MKLAIILLVCPGCRKGITFRMHAGTTEVRNCWKCGATHTLTYTEKGGVRASSVLSGGEKVERPITKVLWEEA